MSSLAAHYDGGETRLSSQDIASERDLPKPLVAKLLVSLSQAGLITGAPGPGGGYSLARDPEIISLLDVVTLFEKKDDQLMCPFGPSWCGHREPCPLHDRLSELNEQMQRFLEDTSFAVFTPEYAPAAHAV